MPATATGRGGQVILTGQVRRASRGAAGASLVENERIKVELERLGSISAGYSSDGRTVTAGAAHDVAVLAPETELDARLGSSTIGARLRRAAAGARWSNPHLLPLFPSPPTITIAATKDATHTQLWRWGTANQNVFNYYGGDGTTFSTNFKRAHCVTVSGVWIMGIGSRTEFLLDGSACTIMVWGNNGTAGSYRILIDGQYVSMTATSSIQPSAVNYIKLDFGSRVQRRVMLETNGQMWFSGVYTKVAESVVKPPGDVIFGYVVGDSYTNGANAPVLWDGFAPIMCDCLGIKNSWNGGVGGTGFLSDNGGTQTTARGRISDLTHSANPEVIFVAMGHNDLLFTPAQETAEVIQYLTELRAYPGIASVPVFVFGNLAPYNNSGQTLTQAKANDAAIGAAVAAMNDQRIVYIPVCNDPNGPWMWGTGTDGAPAGDGGNADVYCAASDHTHPNAAGHMFLGQRCADAVINVLASKSESWP